MREERREEGMNEWQEWGKKDRLYDMKLHMHGEGVGFLLYHSDEWIMT